MVAQRKTPAPSNASGPFGGTSYMEAANAEVQALWQYVQVPLSTVGGTANAITATCDVPLDTYKKGQQFLLTPVAANTGAATINIDGKGTIAIKNRDGSATAAGRLAIGRTEVIVYNGTNFWLMNDQPPSTGGFLRSIFAYQTNVNVAGQAFAAGWSRVPLNTLIRNDIPGLTFDSALNKISLPAKTYDWIDATVNFENTAGGGNSVGTFLWNITDNQEFPTMARQTGRYVGNGRTAGNFTLASAKDAELRIYAVNGGLYGLPLNITSPSSMPERWGWIEIRVAS